MHPVRCSFSNPAEYKKHREGNNKACQELRRRKSLAEEQRRRAAAAVLEIIAGCAACSAKLATMGVTEADLVPSKGRTTKKASSQ